VTFFSLLSIYLYLRSRQHIALISFLFALASKEIALGVLLFLLSLTLFQRKKIKPLFPFFSLAIFYFAYQLAFLVTKEPVGTDHSYATTSSLPIVWRNFRFYLSTPWLLVIGVSLIFAPRRRALLFFTTALLTLFPALILRNRQETYYLYLPLAYLCLYLAILFPNLRPKTSVLYIAVFLLLGGRQLLPPIAHQDFTNWQKHSIEQIISLVRNKLETDPDVTQIAIDNAKLERDARLMLESDTVDLFLPISLAKKYHTVKVVY
jgi:hypothetical protein